MIAAVAKYLGWRDWAVFRYNSVLENIFLFFYIALKGRLFSQAFLADFLLFLAFSVFSTTYGYLVNDLGDRELDRLHGKPNTFRDDSFGRSVSVVLVSLLLCAAAGIRFADRPCFLPLWIAWGLVATFYSLKPLRLKERGRTGLFFVVVAQRVLPALLIFAAFRHEDRLDVAVFTLYVFFRGLSSDLNHQLEDHGNDSLTETKTYAVSAGFRKAWRLFRFSLTAERALLLACLLVMCVSVPGVDLFGVSMILPVLLLYLLVFWMCRREDRSAGPGREANPFVPGTRNVVQFAHHGFPSVVLPFWLLILLAFEAWIFAPVLLAFAVWRRLYSPGLWRGSFPLQAARNLLTGA